MSKHEEIFLEPDGSVTGYPLGGRQGTAPDDSWFVSRSTDQPRHSTRLPKGVDGHATGDRDRGRKGD